MTDNEPTLEDIEDYEGHESKKKKSIINKVIIFCLVIGAILAIVKVTNNSVSDYIGTPQNPGINTAR
jgi:hypothetical protein